MKTIFDFKIWLLYAVVFTLPMYMKLNNIILGVFIVFSLIDIIFVSKKLNFKKYLAYGWPIIGFFVLAVLASFRTMEIDNIKSLETHWSLLFVPLLMLSENELYQVNRRSIFMSLIWGCLATLVICYANLVLNIVQSGEPLRDWLQDQYFPHGFTEIADTHPAYLSLFLVTAILFLIQDRQLGKILRYVLLIFFLFGLFQLACKMALLLFVLFLFFIAVRNIKHYKQQLLVLVVGVSLCTSFFWSFESYYMQNRMFSVDAIFDEKRGQRWEVSYQIFRENPFTGVGYHKIDKVRKEKYEEGGYSLAAANDLNAHNQFLEYLSVNGAIGGFVYAIALAFLFFLSIYKRDHLFTFIFFAFFLANLTESMMVRIKGIEYYAIFGTLFLCSLGMGSQKEPIGTSQKKHSFKVIA